MHCPTPRRGRAESDHTAPSTREEENADVYACRIGRRRPEPCRLYAVGQCVPQSCAPLDFKMLRQVCPC